MGPWCSPCRRALIVKLASRSSLSLVRALAKWRKRNVPCHGCLFQQDMFRRIHNTVPMVLQIYKTRPLIMYLSFSFSFSFSLSLIPVICMVEEAFVLCTRHAYLCLHSRLLRHIYHSSCSFKNQLISNLGSHINLISFMDWTSLLWHAFDYECIIIKKIAAFFFLELGFHHND